ncbi:MAG: hypothetical protein IIA27_01835, partial [Gemmatimonadetes bacterium]|nr:hypothetical protein [Gemmatimonadota bacterium]
MIGLDRIRWQNQAQFYALAAQAMQRILCRLRKAAQRASWCRTTDVTISCCWIQPRAEHLTMEHLSPERWQQIQDLLNEALECDAAARDEFLERACGRDSELLRQVRSLLTAHLNSGPLTDEIVAPVVAGFGPTDGLEGKTVSHYAIIERLSGGGTGVVYKARDAR